MLKGFANSKSVRELLVLLCGFALGVKNLDASRLVREKYSARRMKQE